MPSTPWEGAYPIYKWFEPTYNAIMTTKISLDKGGRVVLPKSLRKDMHLEPGDTLVLERDGERITLRPVRPEAPLQKELGIWVYQGESNDVSIPELIDRERVKRLRELMS